MSAENTPLRVRLLTVVTFAILSVGALVMLAVALPTLFLARRFYSEVIGRAIGTAVLRAWGLRYTMHYSAPLPARQTVFISNHNSTIDVFTLIAMGLPRARFFLSGFLRTKIPPIGVIGTIIRIFWTVPQEFPEKRRQIFQRAERILRASGDSVYLSPEGMRVATGEIGKFNRGSFHLATALSAPIVPIYFHIPPQINPGRGVNARPGHIDIYLLPPIETSSWRIEDVDLNKERVRDLFVRVHKSLRETDQLPANLAAIPPIPIPIPIASAGAA
jgi:1-acyl-sn-glycerol-3-phosphate acyltransferase